MARRAGKRRGKSFTERSMFTTGIVGTLVLALVMLVTFEFDRLPFVDNGTSYSAEFAEAGQLVEGDKVIVSGVAVGTVNRISLAKGHVLVEFSIDSGDQVLGSRSRARISTQTLLGKAGLEIDSAGSGSLADGARIPLERTTPPYDITNALSDLTATTADINIPALAKALTTVSGTFRGTPAQLRAALRGLSRVSQTIASRDAALQNLLADSNAVTTVLAQRNAKITSLLGTGTDLLAGLNARRQDIVDLLSRATALGQQLTILVQNNAKVLGPALDQVNKAIALLNRNKKNLQETIDGLRNYSVGLGEAVASGPFFDAYVQNLTAPTTVVPILSGLLK